MAPHLARPDHSNNSVLRPTHQTAVRSRLVPAPLGFGRLGPRRAPFGFRAGMPATTLPAVGGPHATADGRPAPEVLVYCGEGAGQQSVRNTLRALQRCVAPEVQVRAVGALEVLQGDWLERCLLFVMPGGADLPYCKHLNGRGNQLLRDYVSGGGSYLGICAGAYYACRRVEFEPGGPLEVVGDRELGFFPGTARGAAYPGFDYTSERGACAAPLRFQPMQLRPSALSSSPRPVAAPPPPPPPVDVTHGHAVRPRAAGTSLLSCDGGGGGGSTAAEGNQSTEDLRPAAPPRLGQRHLLLTSASHGHSGGGGGRRDRGYGSQGARAGGDAAARRIAEPATGSGSGTSDGYDTWVFCRDYSNGGPKFVLQSGRVASDVSAEDGAGGSPSAPPISPRAAQKGEPAGDAVHADLEVLAVYPELGDALAAVRCRVGEGVAVLCGTHPEMPAEVLTGSVHLYDGTQARHVASLGAELALWEAQRRRLWEQLLAACCVAPTPEAAAAPAQPSDPTEVERWESLRARAVGDDGTNAAGAVPAPEVVGAVAPVLM